MRKLFRKMTAVLLAVVIIALIIGNTTVYAMDVKSESVGLESTGNSTFDAFINDSRWTQGVYWFGDYIGNGTTPKISSWGSTGCCAYAADFAKYCFNSNSPSSGKPYYNINEVRAGDIIHIGDDDNGHWFVVLKRTGNDLYTAEGNYNNYVRIGWNYSISGNKFSSDSRSFQVGFHFQSSSTGISYSVNINDGDAISSNSFPITGTVTYGGKNPWLHLYVDYGWVADTANNSLGNYAFYLDTTKYSDGQHIIGVKITNDDGFDFTTWRTIYIDNTKPIISSTNISEVTDNSYRVCCIVNDDNAISRVSVATWTQSDQSDLIWHECNYNGAGTYFYDCKKCDYAFGATCYYNHIYAYDNANNYAFGEQTATFEIPYSLFKSTYYSEINESMFRVCCEMNNPNDIEKVRIATWATANQSDLIWHDCNFNGFGTYFYDFNRNDYAPGASTYISHVYAYSKSGKCDVVEKRLTYENNPPIISDITISEKTSKGFRISCKVDDENSIKKVEFPTFLANNSQLDLIWYRAEIKDGIATCYIPISDYNNEFGTYFTHVYAYDIFNNLSTEQVTIELVESKCGDTNLDGNINVRDVTAIQRHLADLETFTEEQFAVADTNGDGNVDIADATHLQMYLAEYGVVLGKQS